MLTTLSIAGVSATAFALFLTVHLLTAGAFALPGHAYRAPASAAAALYCKHAPSGTEPRNAATPSASGSRAATTTIPVSSIAEQSDATSATYSVFPKALQAAAALSPISPRAP